MTDLGGAERNRTDDILLAKQTLYQLSYGPVCFAWWVRKDSNLRRRCQQIYSLPPLATRESAHNNLESELPFQESR